MKSLFVKTLSILLAVTLVAGGLPVRMMTPPAAEAKSPVEVDQQTAPGLEEAERARALVLESQGLQWIQWLSAKDGLRLKTNRQPLVFLKEGNGQRLYGANNQAVLFLGEKDGHRVYQVLLGFEDPSMGPKWPVPRPVPHKGSADEGSFVFAFVDTAAEKVLDVVRVDISSEDSDGARNITMRNPTRQAKFLATRDGTLMKIGDDGMPVRLQRRAPGLSSPPMVQTWDSEVLQGSSTDSDTKPAGDPTTCSLTCFLISFITCNLFCIDLGVPAVVLACFFVCGLIYWWICSSNCP